MIALTPLAHLLPALLLSAQISVPVTAPLPTVRPVVPHLPALETGLDLSLPLFDTALPELDLSLNPADLAADLGSRSEARAAALRDLDVTASKMGKQPRAIDRLYDGGLAKPQGFDAGAVDATGGDAYGGLSGQALLERVARDAARGQRTRSYEEAGDAIYGTIDNVEVDGVRGVWSSYSQVFVPGTSKEGSRYREDGDQNGDGFVDRGMNIEHLWPQSYFNKRSPMRSDVHHLLSTFEHPNSMRGRLPFGEVRDMDVIYRTNAGAKASERLFEPPDEVKGEVARALFYFYTRYHKQNILPRGAQDVFWHRSLPTLMRWNREHPPRAWERERNARIEAFQGNRNPYVDDHTLVDRVGEGAFRFGGAGTAAVAEASGRDPHRNRHHRRHHRSSKKRPRVPALQASL